jgi:hypothetical protein
VFVHCFLTLSRPLFLFLENRFGSITSLFSVDIQLRCSFAGEPAQRTLKPFLRTGCKAFLPSADVGLVN